MTPLLSRESSGANMGDIESLTHINYLTVILGVFTILIGIKYIIELFSYFKKKLGIKFGIETEKDSVENRITKLEEHDKWQYDKITEMSDVLGDIKDEVTLMRTQRDNDKLAEYKDKVGQSYRYYHARKYSESEPVPYWNHMEKEALEGLIRQYESHGGSNSFVHSIVEPEIQTWKLVD